MGRSSHLGSQYHLAEQLPGQKVIDSLLHIPAHREQPFRLNVNTYSVST